MKLRRCLSSMALLGFLLGVHKGYIALWKDGDPEPVRVFPYRVSGLPLQDQQFLERGIPITSQSELHRLLQDYLS